MIVVTVGTHTQSFNRLFEEIDKLTAGKKFKERVVAQIGNSTYEPKNIEWFRFTTPSKLRKLLRKASIVITHGGAGSVLMALDSNKPVIMVPRLKKFSESVDDHQLQLTRKLEEDRKILGVYKIGDLRSSIKKAKKSKRPKSRKSDLSATIGNFIEGGLMEKTQIFTMDVEKDIKSAVKFAKLLTKHKLRGEFYICGYLVEEHSEECREIAKNHVIGGHGFYHENFSKLSRDEQLDIIKKTQRTFEKHGMKMSGWRFPGFCFKHDSLSILAERGIYDSSFRLPRLNQWGRLFFIRNWLKNILAEHALHLPRPFPKNLIEKPFSVVDIEKSDFYKYGGRIVTHCYNYRNFRKKLF